MRYQLVALFLVAFLPAHAQSLDSLRFLRGIWMNSDDPASTTDFHWVERNHNRYMIGRQWMGAEQGCPWCVAQMALVAKYDPTRHEVRLHIVDKENRFMDFHLVDAGDHSVQFLSNSGIGIPVYRLTYKLDNSGVLTQLLEKTTQERSGNFARVGQISLRRR